MESALTKMQIIDPFQRKAVEAIESRVRIFVVDDDPLVRDAIGAILEGSGFQTNRFSDAADFLARIQPNDFGCLLVDIRMPGIDGIQLIEQLSRSRAPFAVMVVSGHADVPLAVRAIKAGAMDVIQKPFTKTVLLEQVRKAALAASELNETIQRVQGLSHKTRSLSVREHQVLKFAVEGHSSKETARELGVSPRTVETHRASIMKKMGVKRLAELIHASLALFPSSA